MQTKYAENDSEGILSVAQAAGKLGVHVDTLRRWTKANKVPYFRTPSGHRRFHQADIDAIKEDASLTAEPALIAGGDAVSSPKAAASLPPV